MHQALLRKQLTVAPGVLLVMLRPCVTALTQESIARLVTYTTSHTTCHTEVSQLRHLVVDTP